MSDANLSRTNDSANGCDDPETSQYHLVRGLGKDDNYNRWHSPPGGRTKIDIAAEVVAYINSKGITERCTAEMV